MPGAWEIMIDRTALLVRVHMYYLNEEVDLSITDNLSTPSQ